MRCLILGGTGAMGGHLVERLLHEKHTVYVTSRQQRDSKGSLRYIKGNAHELSFLKECLTVDSKAGFDVIVDFMSYKTDEFAGRVNLLLDSTEQYIFLSSSRVYADSSSCPITEESPRLLDVVADESYLSTDEYALTKARQENILLNSGKSNYTIVRPYITYDSNRLQLGIYEKEQWLHRALNGKPVVFSEDIANKLTTLAHGKDVAQCIYELINNKKAFGQAFHIAGESAIKWKDAFKIYVDAYEEYYQKNLQVIWTKKAILGAGQEYQVRYDRLYDRVFSNDKLFDAIGREYHFISAEEGLRQALLEFLKKSPKDFRWVDPKFEARLDRITKSRDDLSAFPGRAKMQYLIYRYLCKDN